MKKLIHVGIAEDHVLVRQGIVNLLKEYEDINVLFDVGNGAELLDELKKSKPEIVLLDIEMPVMNGKEALLKIREKFPKVKVIIISSHFEDSYVIEFVTSGAAGFLPKNVDIDKVVDAIYTVHEQGFYFDNKVSIMLAQNLIDRSKANPAFVEAELSAREKEIVEMLCRDKTTREIADQLCLSTRTVEGYRKSIMEKTGVKNTLGLISYAVKHKIIKLQ
ncbi:MAG: two component transcriptional regulator, LuxR family [Bacteroidetes bacterium]|jgi:DNA-binding NarL/FixJ family response regulator|nr:two component transcriptional regulator, LuxR family [Bacteroidota bacterium]